LRRSGVARSEDAFQRAVEAIEDLVSEGAIISFRTLARRAGVSEKFLYTNAVLSARIRGLKRAEDSPQQAHDVDALVRRVDSLEIRMDVVERALAREED
jgi:hypothetical protein